MLHNITAVSEVRKPFYCTDLKEIYFELSLGKEKKITSLDKTVIVHTNSSKI